MAPFTFDSARVTARKKVLQQLCDGSDSLEPDEDLKSLVKTFASDVLRRQARPFQVDAVSCLLDSRRDCNNKALGVIRPPGDGKSLCYIMAGCFSNGITLIIQPTLALVADRAAKLEAFSKTDGLKQLFNVYNSKSSTRNN